MTPNVPGLGDSQRGILESIKRRGSATVRGLAEDLGLNVETVREHVRSLMATGLVARAGAAKSGPGRPELVYRLTPAAEAVFPRREGEILRSLAAFLKQTGNEALLRAFYAHFVDSRRQEALARVAGLSGRARVEEVARILTELGFMAELAGEKASPTLRLCHCPLRELVAETKIPCRIEVDFIHELLGETTTRVSHIAQGDESCSYLVGLEMSR